jgi:hypothetical protein
VEIRSSQLAFFVLLLSKLALAPKIEVSKRRSKNAACLAEPRKSWLDKTDKSLANTLSKMLFLNAGKHLTRFHSSHSSHKSHFVGSVWLGFPKKTVAFI